MCIRDSPIAVCDGPAQRLDLGLKARQGRAQALTCFQAEIESLREAIADGDGEALLASLCDAKTVRDALATERRSRGLGTSPSRSGPR